MNRFLHPMRRGMKSWKIMRVRSGELGGRKKIRTRGCGESSSSCQRRLESDVVSIRARNEGRRREGSRRAGGGMSKRWREGMCERTRPSIRSVTLRMVSSVHLYISLYASANILRGRKSQSIDRAAIQPFFKNDNLAKQFTPEYNGTTSLKTPARKDRAQLPNERLGSAPPAELPPNLRHRKLPFKLVFFLFPLSSFSNLRRPHLSKLWRRGKSASWVQLASWKQHCAFSAN